MFFFVKWLLLQSTFFSIHFLKDPLLRPLINISEHCYSWQQAFKLKARPGYLVCPGILLWSPCDRKTVRCSHLVRLSFCFVLALGRFANYLAIAISKVLHKLLHLKISEHPHSLTMKEWNLFSFLWQHIIALQTAICFLWFHEFKPCLKFW